MDDRKNEPFAYVVPKRRATISEGAPDAQRNSEFMRKVLRSQFRRSEYRLQKLARHLESSGHDCSDFDQEEETRKHRQPRIKEEDAEKEKPVDKLPPKEDEVKSPPPSPSPNKSGDRFSFVVRNMHSSTMNRRLSLIENVQKNYEKYIRPPDEKHARPSTSPVPQLDPVERRDYRPYTQGSGLARLYEDSASTRHSGISTPYSSTSFVGLERETSKGNFLSLDAIPMAGHRPRSTSCISNRENVLLLGSPVEGIRSKSSLSELPPIKGSGDSVSVQSRTAPVAEKSTGTDDHLKQIMAVAGAKKFVKKLQLLQKRRKEADQQQNTANRIREIHRQMGLNQRRKLRSSREDSVLRALKGNAEFQTEMRIIMETLQAINIRLDEQLNLLNGSTATRRASKQLAELRKIQVKS